MRALDAALRLACIGEALRADLAVVAIQPKARLRSKPNREQRSRRLRP
jgi:hypothetical protein